jgi:hypothetical protein
MRHSLRYLRWIVLHKLYVFAGGIAVMTTVGSVYERPLRYKLAFLWRLLRHDLSKLGLTEFTAYRQMFYPSETPEQWIVRQTAIIERTQLTAKVLAWLHHIHWNPHHWQHHILHQDDGRTLVLIPHAVLADEMVADWLAAGPKALRCTRCSRR